MMEIYKYEIDIDTRLISMQYLNSAIGIMTKENLR